ncbi:MAG: hypothetical protein ACI4IU_04350 [Candidatus Limousia pullorum]
MNEMKIIDSLNYIDDSLISEAISYKSAKNKIAGIAACLVLLSVILICVSFFNTGKNSLPFSLKAYGESCTSDLKIGEKIPVDIFETASGEKGFIFSYDKPDENSPSAVAVVSEGGCEGIEDEILKIADDSTQNYIFYVVDKNKTFPYTQIFIIDDFKTGEKYNFTVNIIKENDEYFALLQKATSNAAFYFLYLPCRGNI